MHPIFFDFTVNGCGFAPDLLPICSRFHFGPFFFGLDSDFFLIFSLHFFELIFDNFWLFWKMLKNYMILRYISKIAKNCECSRPFRVSVKISCTEDQESKQPTVRFPCDLAVSCQRCVLNVNYLLNFYVFWRFV